MRDFWQRTGSETKGILLIVLAVLLFSVMDTIAKGLTQRHDPIQVVWARYASQTFWAVLILSPRLRSVLATDRLGLQLVRSALLFGATAFFFSALARLQLAEATAIFEVGPLVITILSVLILKEKVGPRRWAAVLAGLVGALVIIRPGTDVFQPAALLPLAAATCFAGYSIATRFLGQDESPFTSLLYTTLIGTVVATIALPFFWSTPTTGDAVVMATFGAIGMVGQLFLILALGYAPASLIAPFGYMALAFNATWGFLFFAEVPDRWTIAGAGIIVGAGLYVWYREMRIKAALDRPALRAR
jgi:drug/metabolite transporter (DMT)-like permease